MTTRSIECGQSPAGASAESDAASPSGRIPELVEALARKGWCYVRRVSNSRRVPQRGIMTDLRARRDELAAELARLTAPPEAGSNLSFGKRIGEGTTEAVERISTTAAARSIAAGLADVDRAIEKLEEGTYGRCDDCGRSIPAARLEAIPATRYCVECSARRSR